jgi:hypothetical protein
MTKDEIEQLMNEKIQLTKQLVDINNPSVDSNLERIQIITKLLIEEFNKSNNENN